MAKARITKITEHVPTTWEKALEQFLTWKKAQGISKQTLDDYRRHVGQFYRRYPDAFGCSQQQLEHQLCDYMADRIKPATYNNRLVYLRSFFEWCVKKTELLDHNPLEDFSKRKAEGRVVDHNEETLIKLINAPDQKTFVGLRDYALILLTLDTGVRPKEAFSLLPSDFNPRASELYIRAENAKTRVSRTLNISPQTAKAISDLIAHHPKEWKKGTPIFCTNEGRILTRHTWGDRIEAYSKKLQVKIVPYDLRHSFALIFLRGGGNALALQRTLGHSDLTMTKRYVNLAESDLKEQHAMASPLNRLMPVKKRVSKL